MRSDASAAAFIIEGEAVVASAMICPRHAPTHQARRLQKNYCG
jgi:hypothetical protein